MMAQDVLCNLNACQRGSAVTNGGYTRALKTACSDQERVKTHDEKREKREPSQKIGKKRVPDVVDGRQKRDDVRGKKNGGKRKERERATTGPL
jgi:hypothetical protein